MQRKSSGPNDNGQELKVLNMITYHVHLQVYDVHNLYAEPLLMHMLAL